MSLEAGSTFDLRADRDGRQWDFRRESDRRECRRRIEKEKPYVVVGSPPCTDFCQWNEYMNFRKMDPKVVEKRKAEARMLLNFAMEIYELQLRGGRHFLHEHPRGATSWKEEKVVRLRNDPRVATVEADQCRFGLKTRTAGGRQALALKPTRFMSSSEEILRKLGKKCKGGHQHQQLSGGRASAAAVYPPGLCRAILQGVEAQRLREGHALPAEVADQFDKGLGIYSLEAESEEVHVDSSIEEAMDGVGDEEEYKKEYQSFWDELTGEELPASLTRAARKEELDFMADWEVWEDVPVEECWRVTGKGPLGGKWVDVNKGDSSRPLVRSRYVAKEIARYKSDELFAATPPLEALRLLLSRVASGRQHGRGGRKIMVVDARKAHLHAMVDRALYVDLPPEVRRPGRCARLKRCLYGTRDAPARWEAFLAGELQAMGMKQGKASPCCFAHDSRDLICVVHGDDFTFAGSDADLEWALREMEKRFLVKVVGKLGGDKGDDRELRVLNRIIRWRDSGVYYEADPRHSEILQEAYNPEGKKVTTPVVKTKTEKKRFEEEENPDNEALSEKAEEELLGEGDARLYRSGAARANYLSLDRPDIAYASKELCRRMCRPGAKDLAALRRLVQYLAGVPRLVYSFEWQSAEEAAFDICVDTDYAGCAVTRKSTSGGCALRGGHLIKHWSTTQKAVTLSSAEAELAGIVKGTGEGLGLQSLARDFGSDAEVRVHADSAAALGICKRSGIGRVRHLAVGQLWVQGKLRDKEISMHKIAGEWNPADVLTKAMVSDLIGRHLGTMDVHSEDGRAASAPRLSATVNQPSTASP